MQGIDCIANILKREGVEYLFCFPANVLRETYAYRSNHKGGYRFF